MKPSLTETIENNASKKRFHTPGHAGLLSVNFPLTDVTELPYTDNLLYPVSYLSDLEKKIASAFRAEACFISTQGATHNILQAIFAEKDKGAFLVVGKAHASVFHALRAIGAKSYHVDSLSENTPIPQEVKTAVLTSPDYFGHTIDLPFFCDLLHKKGLRIIVDSAHGSHFGFSDKLPVPAIEYADSVVLSLHKTLPVATGGSILLTKSDRAEMCSLCRKLYHTTSPSFPVLCSIEQCVAEMVKNGASLYEEVFRSVEKFCKDLRSPFSVVETDDKTRLVLRSPYDGNAVFEELFGRGFVAEMSYEDLVVFIVTPYNHNFLPALNKAVNEVRDLPAFRKVVFPTEAHPIPTPMVFEGEPESVALSDALGRKVYLEVGFYPPGVPLLYPGDEIQEEHIRILSDKNNRNHVFGLENGKIFVVK